MHPTMSINQVLDAVLDEEVGKVFLRIPFTPWVDGVCSRERAGDMLSYAGERFDAMLQRCPELRDTVIEAVREAIHEHWAEIVGVARREANRQHRWCPDLSVEEENRALDTLRDLLLEAEATNPCKGCRERQWALSCMRDCELMAERRATSAAGVTDRDFERPEPPEPERDPGNPTVDELHETLNAALRAHKEGRPSRARIHVRDILAIADMDTDLHHELCDWIESDPEQAVTLLRILESPLPRYLVTPDGERLAGRIEHGAVEANLLDILPRLGWTLTDEPDGTSWIVPLGTCAREREDG